MVFLCLFVAFFCSIYLSEASFESQCVVKGSEVDFYCPNEESWRFNSVEVFNNVTGVLNFSPSNETGRQDYLTVVADTAYVQEYSDTSLIHCSQRHNEGNLYAMLVIAGESQPHQQFFPMLSPLSWTSLSLMWSPPVCCCCFSYDYVDYTYTVTLSTESGTIMTETVVPHTGNGTVEVELVLGGHKCDEFQVEISLLGNCQPVTISGCLLLDPVYPKPQGLKAILQNTTSVALTWTHPDTSLLMLVDSEAPLVYSIRGNVAGATVLQYTTVFSVNDTPMEVVDLSGRQCQDILFSVSLEWDCRELSTAVVLPVFPAEFSSEEITVTHFFSANLYLNKIEVSFEAPALCPSQEANYTLVFTEAVSGRSRQVASGPLTGRPGELVRIDITEVVWLKLEENYSVSVTISTVLGDVSSTTEFGICTPFGGVIRDLTVESFGRNDALLSWQHKWLCNFTSAIPVTYSVTASLVGSRTSVYDGSLTVTGDHTRSLPLYMEQYSCRAINYTVALNGRGQILNSTVHTLPAYPVSFEQEVTAEPTFESDGDFKQFEIEFQPPKLCDFQDSSYILSYTGGSVSWTRQPVATRDTGWVVKEEIVSGMRPNTDYIITVTVVTDSYNITSNTSVQYGDIRSMKLDASVQYGNIRSMKLDASVIAVGGSVACVLLLVSVILASVALYCLRVYKRRREKRRLVESVRARANVMVHNPLYEGNDGHYEQLPDCRGRPPPSIPLPSAPPLPNPSYPDSTPQLPPPRENPAKYSASLPAMDKCTPKPRRSSLGLPESKSLSRMSNYSTEDCYTVMNSAGNVTILPRITSSPPPTDDNEKGGPSIKSSDNDDKCADDDDVSV